MLGLCKNNVYISFAILLKNKFKIKKGSR